MPGLVASISYWKSSMPNGRHSACTALSNTFRAIAAEQLPPPCVRRLSQSGHLATTSFASLGQAGDSVHSAWVNAPSRRNQRAWQL